MEQVSGPPVTGGKPSSPAVRFSANSGPVADRQVLDTDLGIAAVRERDERSAYTDQFNTYSLSVVVDSSSDKPPLRDDFWQRTHECTKQLENAVPGARKKILAVAAKRGKAAHKEAQAIAKREADILDRQAVERI